MCRRLGFPLFLFVLFGLFPTGLSACPSGLSTTLQSITPQVAIAGVTEVYVLGFCFGESQSGGSPTPPAGAGVTINNTPVTTFLNWSDGEIVFTVPLSATSGTLAVTGSYGQDSSDKEADCSKWGWCGTASVNATFTVVSPSGPPFVLPANSPGCNSPQPCPPPGTPSAPQYAEGTWNEDDGVGDTATYTLSQGSQNGDGTFPITGTVNWSYYYGQDGTCQQSLTGTLTTEGYLILSVQADAPGGCAPYGEEFAVLHSGDMTSQGLFDGNCGSPCNYQGNPNFPNEIGDEDGYALWGDVLVKAETDLPAFESPTPQGWSKGPASLQSQRRTVGRWERILPMSSDGFVEFAGRFVYEQKGGQATDGCWFTNSKYLPYTSVLSGGGWYVDQNGLWGPDGVGLQSQVIDYYQANNMGLPCEVVGPQVMYIDGGSGPRTYTTNQLMPAEIEATQLLTGVQPNGGQMVTECRQYPGTLQPCN